MTNRRRLILNVAAAALVALFLPVIASAQGNYDPWGRDRDYRRDRGYGNDDYYGGRNDRYGVRESARRLKDYAHQLQRDLDHALDHSREDGTRHEDRLNAIAQQFRDAASDLKDRVGNGRDLNRSSNEARRVLDLGQRLERRIEHHFDDYRIRSDWERVSQELRVIANAYGSNRGYDNGGYYDRDDDRYGNRRDNQRGNNNDPWWRRLP